MGYITPLAQSQSEGDESLLSHSSSSFEWESDVSVGVVFKNLFVNMTLINQLEKEEAIEIFDTEPWAQQLDLQWEKLFEQREPPTCTRRKIGGRRKWV